MTFSLQIVGMGTLGFGAWRSQNEKTHLEQVLPGYISGIEFSQKTMGNSQGAKSATTEVLCFQRRKESPPLRQIS